MDFIAINHMLKSAAQMRPMLWIDLDALDHNIDTTLQSIQTIPNRTLRLVEKSLPSPALLRYIMRRAKTRQLMSFHQPFLNQSAHAFPDSDILLGKPLPVGAANEFYTQLTGNFDPKSQLQWLIDTPERLIQYGELARGLGITMQINIELDIGLHRGGVANVRDLHTMLTHIDQNPYLAFSGFMGYEPHVAMLPRLLGKPETLLKKSMARYAIYVEYVQRHFPQLWHTQLTLNSAGSPTYRLHTAENLSTELSVGTGLLKPSHYDLATLATHQAAIFIAAPVLKKTGAVQLPELPLVSRWWASLHKKRQQSYFIYGGNWMADPVFPQNLAFNTVYGRSSNQELLNGASDTPLAVDDHLFLRPHQTEAVLLQFGAILAVRGTQIVDSWSVFNG